VLKFHTLIRKYTIVSEKHENSLFLASLLTMAVAVAPFYLKTLEVSGQRAPRRLDKIHEIKLP